jgi:hypothetical protein
LQLNKRTPNTCTPAREGFRYNKAGKEKFRKKNDKAKVEHKFEFEQRDEVMPFSL